MFQKIAESALGDLDELKQMSKYPYSLEGVGGLVSLLIDLERPTSDVIFPFFEYPVSRKSSIHAKSSFMSNLVGHTTGRHADGGNKKTPKKDRYSSSERDRTSKIPSPQHGKQYGKSHATSVAGTATTVSFTTADYETPPRRTSTNDISPLTEPSPGNDSQNNVYASKSAYPLTEAKIRKRREDQKRAKQQQQQQQQQQKRTLFPSRLAPPQVKRHIHTSPDDVPLANRPTESWRNKLKYGTTTEPDDSSIERKQRAEASYYKYKVHNYYKPSKMADNISKHSIRRMVGGFHHDSPKPTKLTTSNSAAHLYADLDESSSSLLDSVMEQLRECLEQGTKVM
jgi:hypothetical protein